MMYNDLPLLNHYDYILHINHIHICSFHNLLHTLINLNFQYDYAKTISNLLDYSLLVLIKCIDEEKNNETKEEKTQEETNVVSDEKKKVLNLCIEKCQSILVCEY